MHGSEPRTPDQSELPHRQWTTRLLVKVTHPEEVDFQEFPVQTWSRHAQILGAANMRYSPRGGFQAEGFGLRALGLRDYGQGSEFRV